jgi:hypothetical protein
MCRKPTGKAPLCLRKLRKLPDQVEADALLQSWIKKKPKTTFMSEFGASI